MTATTTPRLALMQPASSDDFVINDFVDTFTKLDNAPGVTPVANYASITALASTLTTAQNGSIYLQSDNGSLWQWVKPGSSAGVWTKINNVGMIKTVTQTSTVSTTAGSAATGPSMVNTTFTFPGGRWCVAMFISNGLSNSGSYGYSASALFVNGTQADTAYMSGGGPNKTIKHILYQPIVPGGYGGATPGSTVTIKAVCYALPATGGGTTTALAGGQLYIWEV